MENSLVQTFWLTFRYEALLIYRHYSEVLHAVLFFALVITLFPLAIGPDSRILQLIAPGIIWIAILLAILLAQENLFQSDQHDGMLEQFLLSPQPLALLVLAKLLARWVIGIMPLIFIAMLFVPILHLSVTAAKVLCASLLLGTPILMLIGAIGRALTIGLRNSGLLVILLVVPLYIPVLILGAGSVGLIEQGISVDGQLLWLAVILLLALPLAPLAIAAALRAVNH